MAARVPAGPALISSGAGQEPAGPACWSSPATARTSSCMIPVLPGTQVRLPLAARSSVMYIGIGTLVVIVIIILVVLMLRRR